MNVVKGDLWSYHDQGGWVVVTTNTQVDQMGKAIMGRGIALQAKQRFPELTTRYGQRLQQGSTTGSYKEYRLIMLPTKIRWSDPSPWALIERAPVQLNQMAQSLGLRAVYLPPLGCGNGGLSLELVQGFLAQHLDNRFTLVLSGTPPPLTRWVNIRSAQADVYVGRNHRTPQAHYGNPFSHKDNSKATIKLDTRAQAIHACELWLIGEAYHELEPERRAWILEHLPELKGKVLGCYCAPQDCHARVLARLADQI